MRVLVAVAHPDDETLMAGGAVARHVEAGDEVLCSYFTDGVSSRGGVVLNEARKRRREEFEAAVAVLGAQGHAPPVGMLDYDQRLDQLGVLDLAQRTERLLEQWRPEVVYTHCLDPNQDHLAVFRAVLVATRPYAGGEGVRAVYAGELPGHPLPDGEHWGRRYVALSGAQLRKKLRALACYKSEARGYPHPRSDAAVAALAQTRGVECGRDTAEAFAVVREVWV